MALDRYNRLSVSQDISGTAGGEQSTDVWDLDQGVGLDWKGTARTPDPSSGGHNPIIEVRVTDTELATAIDGGTLTISLYEHTAATSIESGNLIAISPTLTVNTTGTGGTAVGTVLWRIAIPSDTITERYVGLYYTRAVQTFSTGVVDAAVLWGTEKQYP